MAAIVIALALCLLPSSIDAVPAPTRTSNALHPIITARARLSDRNIQERNILDDADSYINSAIETLPSKIASGVSVFFQDLPTSDAVLKTLGIEKSELDPSPTQVLNIPGYGNWTDQGWNLRFRGNVYKQPKISEEKLNDLANVFLVGTDIEDMEPAAQTQARNLTAEIFIVQEPNANVSFNIVPVPAGNSDSATGSSAAMAQVQEIQLGEQTTLLGDYDAFRVLVGSTGPGGYLIAGNETQSLQKLGVYTNGTLTGNATAMLVPPIGLTVISDIDDILRVTRIFDPADGLMNTFARPFTPWMNMPDMYAGWDRDFANTHFHYLTTTPEQATRNYMEFIFNTYPSGTFDTRPLNFSDIDATLSIRKYLLTRIFETFPERKFVLVADTSNADVMKAYPGMATEFPNQVQCIFLRNTSSTDSANHFPYDTSGFENLNQNKYMFFNVPDDLTGLDIPGGQCSNQSVVQNVTFSTQGLPFGLSKDKAKKSMASRHNPVPLSSWVVLLSALAGLWLMNEF